jgi:hypothetical protein
MGAFCRPARRRRHTRHDDAVQRVHAGQQVTGRLEALTMAATQPLFTPVGSSHLGRPSLLARYGSLPELRHAIDTLEGDGVDGDDLTIVAPAGHVPGGTPRRRADSRVLSHTMLALAIGVLGGAVLGALVGAAVIGLVLLLWSSLDATGWVFALLTVWFAAGGAVLGCFFAISRVVGFSESWPLTFEDDEDGPVWLAVFEDVGEASALADRTHALEVVTDPAPLVPAH